MKGISAVIAVILILMITVALAAMAYVWFTGVFETITTGAGQAATGTATTIATSFSIAGATNTTKIGGTNDPIEVYVTNTGSANITIENFVLLVDGEREDITESGQLGPTETETLTSTVADGLTCGSVVKVRYGSLEHTTTILC